MKKMLVALVFAICSLSVTGQSIWIGGTPGRETDWMEARNWLDKKIPGSDDYVLIAHIGQEVYPVIRSVLPEIAGLEIEGGARLEVLPEGVMTVVPERQGGTGLSLIGTVTNQGVIRIGGLMKNTTDGGIENLVLAGEGKVVASEGNAAVLTWVEK